MKLKQHIRTGVLLIHLLLFSVRLTAQATEATVNEPASIANPATGNPVPAVIEQPDDSITNPVQTRSCVTTFTNRTVSSYTVIVGCDTLYVKDITVTGSGDLYLTAPGYININGAFEVALGGQLNVHTMPPPPIGNTMQIAINIGTFGAPFQYTDTKNTAVNYTNDYVGQSTNDVFYVFTLTTAMNITIKHCDSAIGTYVHLLNSSGTSIANNGCYSGADAYANSAHDYPSRFLSPGTYYIIMEGYSANGSLKERNPAKQLYLYLRCVQQSDYPHIFSITIFDTKSV